MSIWSQVTRNQSGPGEPAPLPPRRGRPAPISSPENPGRRCSCTTIHWNRRESTPRPPLSKSWKTSRWGRTTLSVAHLDHPVPAPRVAVGETVGHQRHQSPCGRVNRRDLGEDPSLVREHAAAQVNEHRSFAPYRLEWPCAEKRLGNEVSVQSHRQEDLCFFARRPRSARCPPIRCPASVSPVHPFHACLLTHPIPFPLEEVWG